MQSELFRLPDNYTLDDVDIFAYRGVTRHIHGYGDVKIQQLSAWQWFYVYLPRFGDMVRHFNDVFPDVTLLDGLLPEHIKTFRDIFIRAFMREKLRMQFVRMLRTLGVFRGGIARFLKAATISDLFDVFFLLYVFNTEGLKKKFTSMLNGLHMSSNTTSATSSTNASGAGGSTGMKVVEKIDIEAWKTRFKT